jgi:hypothetical protein
VVPVAAEVGGVEGHHHHVADAHADLLVAARAEIGLAGLVGLDRPDLDLVVQRGIDAHSNSTATTRKAAATKT